MRAEHAEFTKTRDYYYAYKPSTGEQEQEAAYSQRLKREVRSECQAIAALSSLACKAQRRILELERRVFAMAGRFEMEPDTTCELQAAIFKALKKQLKKKDMEVGQLKAALKVGSNDKVPYPSWMPTRPVLGKSCVTAF